MIIEQLVVHDFGIYGGRHEIDLAPLSPDRPIILIGARNGRGKTTLLDAINLVLFGSRARLSNRGAKSWEDFLRESIHRKARGGSSVSIRFTVADDFDIRTYEATRSWVSSGKYIKEYFDVSINGNPDKVLAEDWNEHIEGILPLDVASLNFFDGEKIDELTNPGRSRDVIGAAIRGLLGLGILERLESDLKVYLRRKQDVAIADEGSEELHALEAELDSLVQRREERRFEQGQSKVALERSQEVLRRLEQAAAALGAERWQKRAELESERIDLVTNRLALDQRMHGVAAGAAPLLLLRDLLERTSRQLHLDQETEMAKHLNHILEERDERIVVALPDTQEFHVVGDLLRKDRSEWATKAAGSTVHSSQTNLQSNIAALVEDTEITSELAEILDELDRVELRMSDVDRALMAVPSDGQLAPVLTEIGIQRGSVESLNQQNIALSDELEHLGSTIERTEQRLARLLDAEADRQKEALEEKRAREYAKRAIETVKSVADLTVARNLSQIETSILQRFNQLIGKQGLVTGIHIDSNTLELAVSTGDREDLAVERMSAGERQLLATAVLWGLSTVAGRSIPLIIDTPLGRLDEEHRQQLASNYFPNAANQVIILSTNSEFDESLRTRIEHAISHEYLIQFREDDETSEIVPGYFVGSS
jgi:DNA sulfur modification protein DndD